MVRINHNRLLVSIQQAEPGLWNRFLKLLSHGSSMPLKKRLMVYLWTFAVCLALVWLPVFVFVSLMPERYSSSFSLILPGSGNGHAVSFDSVGQANATVASPYASHSVDPKVNYKALALSKPVLAAAAAKLEISPEQYGKPRIKLVDQTALMDIRLTSHDPVDAYNKSQALYCALLEELERLRNDELQRREASIDRILDGFSEKLRTAQLDILEYQQSSEIVSVEQFAQLTTHLEQVRNDIIELEAQYARLDGQTRGLRRALQVTAAEAAAILDLQQDVLFAELVTAWAESSAELTKNLARWGRKHQQVVSTEETETELRAAMVKRARQVAPSLKADSERLVILGTADKSLYQQLVELSTEQQGIEQQLLSLRQGMQSQKSMLDRSTTDASNLEDLKRKHQVATAVFTTALAKLDIGKSDHFSSYPMVQLLAKPVLPKQPDRMFQLLALLGGLAASLFCLAGLVLLWIRKPYLQKILKNA